MSKEPKQDNGEFSLEDILAEFGSGTPEKGVAQNHPYTPEQEAEDLREKQEEAFFFPPKPKQTPPPVEEVSSEDSTEEDSAEPSAAEREERGEDEDVPLSDKITAFPRSAVPPAEPIEEKPTPAAEQAPVKDKVMEVEFPTAQPENPVAAGIDQLRKKADSFADHMFEQADDAAAKRTRRAERLIPGVDVEDAPPPPPKRERKPRRVAPPPPDTPPKELLRQYSKGFKSFRIRTWLVMAMLLCLIYLTLTPAVIPPPPKVPFLTDPVAMCYVIGVFHALALALGIDTLWKAFARVLRGKPGLDIIMAISNLLVLADAFLLPTSAGGATRVPYSAVAVMSLWCTMYGDQQKRRGQRISCRTAATASEPYIVTRDEGAWNNRDTYAKWSGTINGFGSQLQAEDGAERIFRVLAPLLLVACTVFALLSSVGQGKPENTLWCFASTFTAACPLSAALCFGLPWQKLTLRLSKTGAALAGWEGVTNTTGGSNLILTDIDLFPVGNVTLNGIKIFGTFPLDRIVSYTASAIRDAGSGLEKAFYDLLRSQGAFYRKGELFTTYEGGGVSEVFGNDLVQVGSASFMVLMEVPLPPGLKVKNAVFCAVNGTLAGIFALSYSLPGSVPPALDILIHNRITPVLCTRDFNLIPAVLRQRFKLPSEKMEYPSIERRRELSDPKREHSKTLTAVLCREGLGPYADAIVGGRRLRSAVRLSAALACLGSVVGLLLSFYLTFVCAFESLTAVNLLIFLSMWLVPTPLIAGWVNRY